MREYKNKTRFLISLTFFISFLLVFNHFVIVLKINVRNNHLKIQSLNADLYPIANFIANPRDVMEGELIQFNFTGNEGDPPATFYWDFGDGQSSSNKNPTHHYDFGSYAVNLTVTDFDGDSNTISKKDYISVMIDLTPVVDFTVNITSVRIGQDIRFTFTGISDNPPNEFLWNFGDRTTSTESNPKHRYGEEGDYSIRLKVTDKQGDDDILSKENYISVYSSEPSVPSYNIFILLGIVILFSLVIYRIQRKQFRST